MSIPISASAITAAAEEEVQMEMRSYVNTSAHTYKKIKNSDVRPVNVRGTFIPGELNPNGTFGGGAEGFIFPIAGGRELQRMSATYRRYAMFTRFSNDALESVNMMVQQTLSGNKQSDGSQIGVQCDIMVFGTGEGFRGTVQVSASGSTPTLTFYVATGGVGLNDMGTSLFFKGGLYEFRAADGTLRTGGPYTCTGLTGSTATFNGNINAAVVAGDYIVYKGMYNNEYQGYQYHLDNSTSRTYQGLAASGFTPKFLPFVEDEGGEMLNVGMMQRVKQALITKRGVDFQSKPHYWLFPPCQAESFLGLGQALGANNSSLLRDSIPGSTFDPQWKTTAFAGEMIDINEKMPTTDAYYIHDDLLQRYPLKELDIYRRGADADGLMTIPAFDNTGAGNFADQSQYGWVWKENLGSADPGMAGRLKNLGTAGLIVPALAA